MAGAPTHWATLTGDADPNPGFRDIWMHEFDAISPWTIGRYNNEESADKYAMEKVKTDMELLSSEDTRRGRKVDYVPVVFPGGSVSLYGHDFFCLLIINFGTTGIQPFARKLGIERYTSQWR